MSKLDVLTGRKFGRLFVLEQMPTNKHRKIRWKCICECGNEVVVLAASLRTGNTKSCGCLNRETTKRIKHGHARNGKLTPEYQSWKAMLKRCTEENNKYYRHYGGRGIKVCDSWLNSFENFLSDMGLKPSSDYTLERLNVDGNYEPSNCKWATKTEQARNKRITILNSSGHNGVHWNKRDRRWVATIGVDSKAKSLGYFKELEDAIQARKEAEEKYWNKKSS